MPSGVRNGTRISIAERGLRNAPSSAWGMKFSGRMQSGQHDQGSMAQLAL
jgi:hypothetical protein